MKKKMLPLLMVFLFPVISSARDLTNTWDKLLKKYVKMGTLSGIQLNIVHYNQLKEDPAYRKLITDLATFNPDSLSSRNAKLAFWINSYNLAAVKMITDNHPISGIRKKSSLFNQVWDQEIIEINSRMYTLGTIEHKILRKMNDPRVHFAIVCASLSCPDLRKEVYTTKLLNQQLDEQTRLFLSNSSKGLRIDHKHKEIYISKIFKWFKKDFGDIRKFIARYRPDIAQVINNQKYDIEYLPYNWSLNGY